MSHIFDEHPVIAIWETTQACDLACVHCRATAQPTPVPGELTTQEGFDLVDQVAAMNTPVLIFSGGDPLTRRDVFDLIRRGKSRGLRVGTIPAATPRLTEQAVSCLKEAGLDQMAMSLDAPTAALHDRFRGVPGAFKKTMQAIAWAHEMGLPLQINTVISAYNVGEVDRLVALVQHLGIVFWEVFFLVPVGRGAQLPGLDAEHYETVFAKLYDLSRHAPFIVKITEAPHYRRYVVQRQLAQGAVREEVPATRDVVPAHVPWHERGPDRSIGLAPQGVNAGKGHCFISCTGEVYPSGFLPLSAGNIRTAPLATLYRASPLFHTLRQSDALHGRCGRCEFRALCGGSRSRAYAMTGDYLAEDPGCAYEPSGASVKVAVS